MLRSAMAIFLPIVLLGCAEGTASRSDRPPNFVIILCDDLGWGDIGPFGSTVHDTPNLDRMAAEGRRFTDFYVTSGVCTPTRASLLTGCYPQRVGLHENERGQGVLFPANRRGLNAEEITIAEVLEQRGYTTGVVGKWHLGDQPEFLPTRHGFDTYFGIPYSNDMGREGFEWRASMTQAPPPPDAGYVPIPLLRDETVIETEPDQSLLTRRYTEEAVAFITRHREAPFLLYLAHTMPHQPVHASTDFLGKSDNGIYGDTVEELDWSTGKILSTLEDLDLAENTLVVFTSDNGASVMGGNNDPLKGYKASTWEGGMRVPCIVSWPGRVPPGSQTAEVATIMDLLPTVARLAGADLPDDRVIDGKDVWPLMSGEPDAVSPHPVFYYYRRGALDAVRAGGWKLHFGEKSQSSYVQLILDANRAAANISTEETNLLRFMEERYPKSYQRLVEIARESAGGPGDQVGLYDLAADSGERINLADDRPEIVEELQRLADEARASLGDRRLDQKCVDSRQPGSVPDPVPLVPMVRPGAAGTD
jgi:arylsulfatase A-like enzyme